MRTIPCIQGLTPIEAVIAEVEAWADQSISVEEVSGFPADRGEAIWEGGRIPKLRISDAGTSPAVVGHEVLHLLLRVYGYPDRFEPKHPIISRLDNFLQHKVIFEKYLAMGLLPSMFIRKDGQQAVQRTCAEFAAGNIDATSDSGRLYVKLNSLLGLSEFNGLDEAAKQALRVQLGWLPNTYWTDLETVYKRAKKGPKDYIKAMKQLVRLVGGGIQISPVFLTIGQSKKWPWP